MRTVGGIVNVPVLRGQGASEQQIQRLIDQGAAGIAPPADANEQAQLAQIDAMDAAANQAAERQRAQMLAQIMQTPPARRPMADVMNEQINSFIKSRKGAQVGEDEINALAQRIFMMTQPPPDATLSQHAADVLARNPMSNLGRAYHNKALTAQIANSIRDRLTAALNPKEWARTHKTPLPVTPPDEIRRLADAAVLRKQIKESRAKKAQEAQTGVKPIDQKAIALNEYLKRREAAWRRRTGQD